MEGNCGGEATTIFPSIPNTCPLCGTVEDVYHRTKACPWLALLVCVLNSTFRAVQSAKGRAPTSSDYPTLSVTRAPGLLLWRSVKVMWQYGCMVQFRGEAPDRPLFVRLLHSETAKWLAVPELSLATAVSPFLHALEGWLRGGEVPVQSGSAVDALKRPVSQVNPAPDPHMFRPLHWDKAGRKRARQEAQERERGGSAVAASA